MHSFSFGEIALIFGIVVILFGGSRLASIGKSLGEGIANFKKGLNTSDDDSAIKLRNDTLNSRNEKLDSTVTSYTPPRVAAPADSSKTQAQSQHVIDVEQKEVR